LTVAEPPQFEDGSFLFKIYDRNKQVCYVSGTDFYLD